MFKCEIKTGGAAFCAPDTGDEDDYFEALEIACILEKVGSQMIRGEKSGNILDSNGNNVGTWSR